MKKIWKNSKIAINILPLRNALYSNEEVCPCQNGRISWINYRNRCFYMDLKMEIWYNLIIIQWFSSWRERGSLWKGIPKWWNWQG